MQGRDPDIDGDAASPSFRPPSSDSVCVSAETLVVAESDRDCIWDCESTRRASWQLPVTCRLEGTFATLHRLLQSHVCQTVSLDLHRTFNHRRKGQSPHHVEGQMGKPPRKQSTFGFSGLTIVICSTRQPVSLRQLSGNVSGQVCGCLCLSRQGSRRESHSLCHPHRLVVNAGSVQTLKRFANGYKILIQSRGKEPHCNHEQSKNGVTARPVGAKSH